MDSPLVFVSCRLDRRDARSALIEDADGWPRRVVSPLGRHGGRLCAAARWVREAAGRHLVRFGDGTEEWVVQGPTPQEEFIPLGWAPAAAGPATRRFPTAAEQAAEAGAPASPGQADDRHSPAATAESGRTEGVP